MKIVIVGCGKVGYSLAEQLLPATVSEIDSACTKGIIHKNNAANKKAKIANKLNKAKANA